MGESSNRRFVRRAIAVEIRVNETTDDSSSELAFDSLDLSEGGAFLRSELLLEVGDILEVSFTVPEGPRVHTTARVAWVSHKRDVKGESGMALEFLNLDPAARQAILKFVKSET